MRFPTGGEGGIRTLDILRRTGFQDQRTRPTMRPLHEYVNYKLLVKKGLPLYSGDQKPLLHKSLRLAV